MKWSGRCDICTKTLFWALHGAGLWMVVLTICIGIEVALRGG